MYEKKVDEPFIKNTIVLFGKRDFPQQASYPAFVFTFFFFFLQQTLTCGSGWH